LNLLAFSFDSAGKNPCTGLEPRLDLLTGGRRVSDHEDKSIAESERSPSSEAADKVDVGPPGTNPEDEERPEPGGTSGSQKEKAGPEGKPIVPPSRGTTH
jgi:hypothetical protein